MRQPRIIQQSRWFKAVVRCAHSHRNHQPSTPDSRCQRRSGHVPKFPERVVHGDGRCACGACGRRCADHKGVRGSGAEGEHEQQSREHVCVGGWRERPSWVRRVCAPRESGTHRSAGFGGPPQRFSQLPGSRWARQAVGRGDRKSTRLCRKVVFVMLRAQVSKDRFRVATPARPSPDPAENLKLAFIPGGRPPDKNLRLAVSPDSNCLRT